MMKRTILVVGVLLAVANVASAELVQSINIDFVTIGNPGNPGDTRPQANPTGCGSVDYTYRIGKYEVTNAQWYDFVGAAGAPTGNDGGYNNSPRFTGAQQPTNEISWYEAAQFCNYLTSGDKSQGAYQFSGDNSNPGNFEGIDRDSAVSTYGITYVIPTQDEWYKAAYYTGSGYSTYANGTDIPPIAGDDTNYDMAIGQPWNVGAGTEEQNGTFDMMGNVWEWNETWIPDYYRVLRGGSYGEVSGGTPSSSYKRYVPWWQYRDQGFRVASVPEPTTILLLGAGTFAILRRRRF